MAQHRGTRAGGGNLRGSIFRRHVGASLIARDDDDAELLDAWLNSLRQAEWASAEAAVERRVSDYLRRMPFQWLSVPTEPDGTSQRGYIERNSIALLSNAMGAPDAPSSGWLGRHASSAKVKISGLWNVNHIDETYDPSFLDIMTMLVERASLSSGPPPRPQRS